MLNGAVAQPATQPPDACKVSAEFVRFTAPMPNLAKAFAQSEPIRIVALGSSSTAGTGASNPSKAYPARLMAELQSRFPGREIEVRNLGIGGQLVEQMVARISRDVIPLRPTLVIWQTGVNDFVKGHSVDALKKSLLTGIDILRQHNIDVVLIDQQYYPRAMKQPRFFDYLSAIRDVAATRAVPLLRRYAIMEHLVTTHQYAMADLLAPDGFHLNDRSYACIGSVMADALKDTIQRSASSAKGPVTTPKALPAALVH